MNIINQSIISAAESSIPKSAIKPKKCPVPWWSDEVANAIKNHKRALRQFSQIPSVENLRNFQLLKSRARKIIRSARKQSWSNFVSTINKDTPSKTIWNKIKIISGKNCFSPITTLNIRGTLETILDNIATALGLYFQTNSSSNNYSASF